MFELVKAAALMWAGACIRNKEDREKTIKLFNSLGIQLEDVVKSFVPDNGANNAQIEQIEQVENEEFR